MPTGQQMLDRALTRINERYVNVLVPKNNPNWHGPWDCAEFMSWLVYQVGGFLYGCVDDAGNPATTEAYTGAWQSDARRLGRMVPWRDAAATVGAVLLRYPPVPGSMGHIAVSDGQGGTVEAKGRQWGVTRDRASGRDWDTGVLIPGFTYAAPGAGMVLAEPSLLYGMGRAGMAEIVVRRIQQALRDSGIDPGPIDGAYGPNTTAAVAAYQKVKGLVADGKVGKQTARSLGISLRA